MSRHWTERYVGLPCGTEAGFDCVDLAQLVQQEEFGRTIRVPTEKQYRNHIGLARFRAMAEQVSREKDDYAEPTKDPRDGDAVLLSMRGYSQHVGVFAKIQGEGWVLHAADLRVGPQVVLQRIRDLAVRGMSVEGYYKWK